MTEKLRVYLYFDETFSCNPDPSKKIGRPTLKHKVILSTAEDQAGTCSILLNKYCEKYNAQAAVTENESFKLSPDQLQLQLAKDTSRFIKSNFQPITNYISDYNDVNIMFLPPAEAVVEHEAGSVPCTNFGCRKRFVPGRDDKEETCLHHAGKPVFHDTYKYWSCCKEKKTMEFDEFEQIPPCAKGYHRHDPMTAAVAVAGGGGSATSGAANSGELDRKPLTEEEIRALDEKNNNKKNVNDNTANQQEISAEGLPTRGPREFTAAATAAKKPSQPVDDKGNYRCKRFGCQKIFHPDENGPEACRYHVQGPVFHDTYKFWACCKDKKCADFDEFEKVQGCTVGEHQA